MLVLARVLVPPGWFLGKTQVTFFDKLKSKKCSTLNIPKKFWRQFFFQSKSSVESSNPRRVSSGEDSSNIFRWPQNSRNYSILNIPKIFWSQFFFNPRVLLSFAEDSSNIFRWSRNPRNYSILNIPKKFRSYFFFKSKSSVESPNPPRMSYTKSLVKFFDKLKIEETAEL